MPSTVLLKNSSAQRSALAMPSDKTGLNTTTPLNPMEPPQRSLTIHSMKTICNTTTLMPTKDLSRTALKFQVSNTT